MTKRLKLFLIILLGAIAAACCAVGCKVGTPDREQLLAPYKGGHVTYYANGGYFNRNTSIYVRELYFKADNVPFFDITEKTDGIDVMRSGFDFNGWYTPERYPEGHEHAGEIKYTHAETGETVYPLLHDDKTPVTDSTEDRPLFYAEGKDEKILEKDVRMTASETVYNEESTINSGDEVVVCANWKPALKFVFKLAVDDENKTYEYDGKTYRKGDTISEMPFGKENSVNPGSSVSVSFENATFVANYADAACTIPVGAYNRDDFEGQSEIVVWSKFLDGDWTIVRNKVSTVQSMFTGLSSAKNRYYIIEDIDCGSANIAIVRNVKATVEGNGHTITGINISPSTALGNGVTVAPLLGRISAGASIKNLTLKDISITLKCKGELTFYAIASEVEEGATLENLTVDGITATVSAAGGVTNATDGDLSNWLFGGSGTDEQFLTSHKGVTVKGENTLTIN